MNADTHPHYENDGSASNLVRERVMLAARRVSAKEDWETRDAADARRIYDIDALLKAAKEGAS